MRETKTIEFKESVTNSFLKTVSAYANYDGGTVLFGVNDHGQAVGLSDPIQQCLNIENRINDAISPRPEYSLDIREADDVVALTVRPGTSKPYLYRSKAYKRSDASTVEVDNVELTRLILEGQNVTFEQLPAKSQDLEFVYLGELLSKHLALDAFTKDTLKTLELYKEDSGYNNAAAILADRNSFPGVDLAQFGESINVIIRRVTSEGKSALAEFDEALQVFDDLYCYAEVVGATRRTVERVPLTAFREALANALVHRAWDVEARVRISMFNDHIEVVSPGGLPTGISEEEYLVDTVSVRRNPILANVFYRLGIIEAFGTGIRRIKNAYEDSASKPKFEIRENSITVILPVLRQDYALDEDQSVVFDQLSSVRPIGMSELLDRVGLSKSTVHRILRGLIERGLVVMVGSGRGTKYRKA